MKFLAAILPLAVATPAAAVSLSQNPDWSAWRGCWQAEGAPANELVCVTPSGAGVRIATLIDGSVRDESTVIADGRSRPVQSVGCSGTERARWSSDGRRVFLESDVVCGATGKRSVRGLFAFVAPDEWISVQAATEGDSVATRIVRFSAADQRSIPASAASFTARSAFDDALLDVDEADVNEAIAQIGAEAAHEWMRLAGEPFELGYAQGRGNGSALEQVGRMSNPVVVREVVRVVERPVYVYDTHYDRHWHYSPWGHHYHGWHWHRPVIVVRWPIVIHRNTHYRRDYWRYDRDRYGRYDYNRGRRDHYDNDWRDRDNDRDDSRGRVTRAGYSNGRDRNVSNPVRTETQPQRTSPMTTRATTRTAVPRETARSSTRETSRASAPRESSRTTSRASSPQRSSGSSRGTATRTARARSSN
jgi:hypothetical protein